MTNSADFDKCLTLLNAALGEFNAKKSLSAILKRVPEFGKFEWMLTIIGLEIDLRVDIPESLADNLDQRADEFARRVAALPKVDSPGYTLECLGLVAQALLSLEPDLDVASGNPQSRAPHTAAARPAKAPRKRSTQAKRGTKAVVREGRPTSKSARSKAVPSKRAKRGSAVAAKPARKR